MLQTISVALAWVSVIAFACSCTIWAMRRQGNASSALCKHHGLAGGIALVAILAHAVTAIVVAAQTHDYSQLSVSAARIVLLLVVVVAISGLVARKHPKPWRTVHRASTVLAVLAVCVHVAAALLG